MTLANPGAGGDGGNGIHGIAGAPGSPGVGIAGLTAAADFLRREPPSVSVKTKLSLRW